MEENAITEIRLAMARMEGEQKVTGTKLDNIMTLVAKDVSAIKDDLTDVKEKMGHDRRAAQQLVTALETKLTKTSEERLKNVTSAIDHCATKTELKQVEEIARESKGNIGKVGWIIITAVLASALGGGAGVAGMKMAEAKVSPPAYHAPQNPTQSPNP